MRGLVGFILTVGLLAVVTGGDVRVLALVFVALLVAVPYWLITRGLGSVLGVREGLLRDDLRRKE